MFQRIVTFPAKHLITIIPVIMVAGFLAGIAFNMTAAKVLVLPLTFLMLYPTMIGVKWRETFSLAHTQVLIIAMAINFLIVPLLAYGIGILWLREHPAMFAGLALAALLPTSGMTISWTMIYSGNVSAAIKMTTVGLILGSLATPWYLLAMVGKLVPVNILQVLTTIGLMVCLPLIAGALTYTLLLKKMTPKVFQQRVKPLLPGMSLWAMLLIIFVSIGMKAQTIIAQPQLLLKGLIVLVVFYAANFLISTLVGRWFFRREDAVALIYGTVMRNLSLSLGMAIAAFGAEAALIVTLAYIVQVQMAAWYGRLAECYRFFPEDIDTVTPLSSLPAPTIPSQEVSK